MGELGVVPHALLEEAGQCREHEGPVDAELVHQLEPRPRLTEGREWQRIGSPTSSRYDLPSGFPFRKYSSWAPGRATTSKVGLGM